MCLRLTYAEALLWKENAAKLIGDAKRQSTKIPCDPLFQASPRLSALVSEIDGIKKRHGLLIERALIFAINKLPHWQAMKEAIPVAAGRAHLDCLAFNRSLGRLYIFECKRGHGSFDADKVRAIDQRLDNISQSIGPHAAAKGWLPSTTETFVLSFYGAKWKSKYPIYDRTSVAKLFEPCIGRFIDEYSSHIEAATDSAYSAELADAQETTDRVTTIFDYVFESRERPWPDLMFDETGVDFVSVAGES